MATVKRRGKTYLIRVYTGYDAEGRQVERTKTWTPPAGLAGKAAEKEAQIQAALFEDQIRNGIEAKKRSKLRSSGNCGSRNMQRSSFAAGLSPDTGTYGSRSIGRWDTWPLRNCGLIILLISTGLLRNVTRVADARLH